MATCTYSISSQSSRESLTALLGNPVQGRGLIVNICSVSSYVDLPLSAAYCASKAALLSVTNVSRMELAPLGVRVMGAPLLARYCIAACAAAG